MPCAFWKVKDGHLTILTDCPFPSFWSELWNCAEEIYDSLYHVWNLCKIYSELGDKMVRNAAWNWFCTSVYCWHS